MIQKMSRWPHLFGEGLKSFFIMGKEEQSFLGAAWIPGLLRWAPKAQKRPLALWLLSLSPHYFYRGRPEYQGKNFHDFVTGEEQRNRISRGKICAQILAPYLQPECEILDLGCGPGFLAKAVSARVKKVYAVDLSAGVLACAGVINGAANILYLRSNRAGYTQVPEASLHLAYSFAVIQHVQEGVIRELLRTIATKLRPDGRAVFQVQLEEPNWRKETDWAQDQSLTGRIKFRYALHCFPRTAAFFQEVARSANLEVVSLRPLSELMLEPFDDMYDQHLLVLKKAH